MVDFFPLQKLPDEIIRIVFEDWLVVHDIVRIDIAACSHNFRESVFKVFEYPGFTIDTKHITRNVEGPQFLFSEYLQYLNTRNLAPRKLSLTRRSKTFFDEIRLSKVESVKSLSYLDVVTEFMDNGTILRGNVFNAVESLTLSQVSPWFPSDDNECLELSQFLKLLSQQFPLLRSIQVCLGNNGCEIQDRTNLFSFHFSNLVYFKLSDTYMTGSSFFSLTKCLAELPKLESLSLFCDWHPDSSTLIEWQSLMSRIHSSFLVPQSFPSLTDLTGLVDVVTLLVAIAGRIKYLGLYYNGSYDDSILSGAHQYLSQLKYSLFSLEKFEVKGIGRIPFDAEADNLTISNLLQTSAADGKLSSLEFTCSTRKLFSIDILKWLLSLERPITSIKSLRIDRKVLNTDIDESFLSNLLRKIPNLQTFHLNGDFLPTSNFESLKPIEAWNNLQQLKLSNLGSFNMQNSVERLSSFSPILDMRRYPYLDSLVLVNIQTQLNDAYWQSILPCLPLLMNWEWKEDFEIPCVTSHVIDLIVEMCPLIKRCIGMGIWKNLNGSAIFHMARTCRFLRAFHVTADSKIVENVKYEFENLRRCESLVYRKLFIEPKISIHSFEQLSVM